MNTVATNILLFIASELFSEDKIQNLGVKVGLHCGKHTPNKTTRHYQYQFEFYVGGIYRVQLEVKWQFQPERLFALYASKISTKDNPITNFDKNAMPYISSFDFQHTRKKSTGSISPVLKLNRS